MLKLKLFKYSMYSAQESLDEIMLALVSLFVMGTIK